MSVDIDGITRKAIEFETECPHCDRVIEAETEVEIEVVGSAEVEIL